MSSVYEIFSDIISRANTLVSSPSSPSSPSSSSSPSSPDENFKQFIDFLDKKNKELNDLSSKTIGEEDYKTLMKNLNTTITEFSNQIKDNKIVLNDEQRNALLQKLNEILEFLKTVSPNEGTNGVTPTSDVTPDSLKETLTDFLTPNNTPQSSPENGGSKRKTNRKSRKSNRKSRKSYKNKRKSYRKSKK